MNVGDVIKTKDSSTGNIFGELYITKKERTTFAELPIDQEGHEPYTTRDELRKAFEQYYPEGVTNDMSVVILGFDFIEQEN